MTAFQTAGKGTPLPEKKTKKTKQNLGRAKLVFFLLSNSLKNSALTPGENVDCSTRFRGPSSDLGSALP